MNGEDVVHVHVGARVLYKGSMGIVRYIGKLHDQGDEEWIGVEWDDVTRGKHSGIHRGKHYFTSMVPNAATFVKANRLGDGGRVTFLQAAQHRFADAIDHSHREFTTVVGGAIFDIADEGSVTEEMSSIAVLDVSNMGVAVVASRSSELRITLPRLRELYIARSLFTSIKIIMELMWAFPILRFLDASRNVLRDDIISDDKDTFKHGSHALEYLIMNHCILTWRGIRLCCGHMASLRELRLHNCKLRAFGEEVEQLLTTWHNLRVLDLDENSVTWDDVRALSTLSELRELYVSRNGLTDCGPLLDVCKEDNEVFPKLHTLSVAENMLEEWGFLTWLHFLPALQHLRVAGNPLTISSRIARLRIIARIEHLARVDGSWISADERLHAERNYTRDEILPALQTIGLQGTVEIHPRTEQLLRKHGETVRPKEIHREGGTLRDESVVVSFKANDKLNAQRSAASRLLPITIQVERLAAVARCVLRIDRNMVFQMQVRSDVTNNAMVSTLEDGQSLSTFAGVNSSQIVVICVPV